MARIAGTPAQHMVLRACYAVSGTDSAYRPTQELTGTMAGLNGWLCPHVDEEGDNGQREPKKESKLTETVRH
eukprot:801233-Rhodomonas_salina.1